MIKALIFDLDNTLIDRRRAFKEMLEVKFSELCDNPKLVEEMVKDTLLWDDNGTVTRDISLGNWAKKYHYDLGIAKKIGDDWSNESGKIAYLYPDVKSTLNKLKEKYIIAILSNGNTASQRRKLETINIYNLIDYSLVSGETSFKKPEKEIFDLVLNDLKIKADETVYIGDTYKIDVVGARNANIKPIYIDRFNETHDDVYTIHEISDLLNVDFNEIK